MNKLERFLLTTGIVISSLIPLKSQAQEQAIKNTNEPSGFYYGGFGFSIKRFNNLLLDEYFGGVFGIKGGVGLNTGKLSRIEFEAELDMKKNKEEAMEVNALSGGAYYDIVLNPKSKMIVYGGIGVKATSLTLQIDLGRNQSEQVKTSGIGYGVRGGVEGKIDDKSTIYFEITYDDLKGTLNEETTNLSGSGLTFGMRTKF